MSVEFRQRSLNEYGQILWKRKWLILLPTIAIATAVGWIVLGLPSVYESTTRVVVKPPAIPENFVPSLSSDKDLALRLNNISREVTSRPTLERLIKQFDPYKNERLRGESMEVQLERMRKDMIVKIDASRNIANAFSISYRGNDPRKTQLIAAEIASGYVNAQAQSNTTSSTTTKEFFDQQIAEAKANLDVIDKRRLQFMMGNLENLPSQSGSLLGQLTGLYERQRAYIAEIGRLRDLRTSMSAQLNDIKQQSELARADALDTIGDPKNNALYGQFAASKARLEAELKSMLTTLKPQNPDVKMKQAEIESVQQQMDQIVAEGKAKVEARQRRIMENPDLRINGIEANLKLMDGNLARLERQQEETNQQISEIEARINRVPGAQVALDALNREYETQKVVYDDLLGRSNRANLGATVASNAQGETIQVIEPANYPETPVAPKRGMLFILGIVAGLAVGLFLAVLFEVPSLLTIQTRSDAEHYTNLPVLVSIPLLLTPQEERRKRLRRVMLTATAAVVTVGSIPLLIMLLKVSNVFARFGA